MAFFSKGKEQTRAETRRDNRTEVKRQAEVKKEEPTIIATTISKNIKVEGNISGVDNIQVDGTIMGDIAVNSITIGKNGSVTGNITAQKVVVSGKTKGTITCNSLDILPTGYVTDNIHANKITLSGEILGTVLAETSITVTHTGKAKTNSLVSKNITVNGTIEGKISASELLAIGSNGFVNGEISVKNIKTDEGGRVIGSMAMYTPPATEPASIQNKRSKRKQEQEVIDATIEESR